MRMDAIIRLAEDCRERRKPPRCAECEHHGAPDCAWSIEVTPDRKPSPVWREETMEERVRRLFAAANHGFQRTGRAYKQFGNSKPALVLPAAN